MIARFHLESMDLAKLLVFGLGTQVAVVEPPELHAAVVQTACEMLKS
jgi:predicted DNA-binding transcriptional regulator YafY